MEGSWHPNLLCFQVCNSLLSTRVLILIFFSTQKDPQQALKELAKMCILADCTLVLAWR